MIHPKPAFQILVLAFLFLWGSPAALWARAPQVDIPKTTYDFGKVFEDKELSHTFVIKNSGDGPLKITNIDPDCACTAADYDPTISPLSEGRLKLTIAPYSVLRQFTKKTKVFFNDPDRPMVVFSLKGYGKPIIEIQPTHIIRLRGRPGEDIRGQVRLISHLSVPWEIKSFKTTIPRLIDVALEVEQPGKIYVLKAHNKQRKPGSYKGNIVLLTTSRKRRRIIVRVFAEISPTSR